MQGQNQTNRAPAGSVRAVGVCDRRNRVVYVWKGRMLHDPKIVGSPSIVPPKMQGRNRRAALPIRWPVVQATTWRSEGGNVCYAVVNLSDSPQSVKLEARPNGMSGPVSLSRIDMSEPRTGDPQVDQRLPSGRSDKAGCRRLQVPDYLC
jgi:hypothetical protein